MIFCHICKIVNLKGKFTLILHIFCIFKLISDINPFAWGKKTNKIDYLAKMSFAIFLLNTDNIQQKID